MPWSETVDTLRAVLRAAPVAIVGVDPDGRVRLWTPAAERLFGWSEEEALGRFSPFVPEERIGEFYDRLARALGGEELHEQGLWRQRRDGSPLEVSSSAAPLRDREGKVVGLVEASVDRSARRQTEAELAYRSFLLASVSDAVVASDAGFALTAWNRAAEALYGWGAGDVIGQPAERVLQTEFEGASREEVRQGLAESGGWHGEVTQRTKDGDVVRVETRARALRDANGRVLGYVSVNRDVTREREAAQAREQLEAQLRQAQKMQAVGQLAAGVAHDFNNLLTAIRGYGELLRESLEQDHARLRDAEEIVRAAERGSELTRRLLAFSRRERVDPVLVDVGRLVEELEPLLGRSLGASIELRLDPGPSLPPVLADPHELEQVLLNLATNARDAMPGGGRLSIAVSGGREGEVAIEVSDTGEGMSDDVLARAFEPFFTTKERGRGTGLGLATVWGIVEGVGGTVELATQPGQGTRVTVWLPARPGERPDAAREPVAAAPRGGAGTILLVEDEEAVRTLAERMLAGGGYEVLVAADATQALELSGSRDGPIDLLLTDLVLPGLPGAELAALMRELRPGLRVLGMSGYAGDEIEPGSAAPEGLPMLAKPFSRAELLARVGEALDGADA